MIKGYLTDKGFEAAVNAQQIYGGHGYIREWGMEQFVRDARIAQIYEGTNGIQALDLVGRKLLLSLALVLLLAQAAAVADPPNARGLPAAAADHVTVAEVPRSSCLTCDAHRRTVTRSGSWVRVDRVYADRNETDHSDFATGISLSIGRDRGGGVQHVIVQRGRPGEWGALTRRATGRRERALGEECEIWSVTGGISQRRELRDGRRHPALEPASRKPRDGREVRAASFERRAVREEEVRPPADLFALAPWPRLEAGRPGYEVVFAGPRHGEPAIQARRSQGSAGSGYRDREWGDGRSYWAGDGERFYNFDVDAQGRPLKLIVQLIDADPLRRRLRMREPRWERVPGRGPRSVLGERCAWQDDMTCGRATRTSNAGRKRACRCCSRTGGTGPTPAIHRAQSLTRRPLTAANLAPPPAARNWARWGKSRRRGPDRGLPLMGLVCLTRLICFPGQHVSVMFHKARRAPQRRAALSQHEKSTVDD